jgi:hypothetical protein
MFKVIWNEHYADIFKKYGPYVHIEMGRPKGPLFTAMAFTTQRVGKLPENIYDLPEPEQHALVKTAIDTMMQEHGETFRSAFTSLNGFTYHPSEDVCIWFNMEGKPS